GGIDADEKAAGAEVALKLGAQLTRKLLIDFAVQSNAGVPPAAGRGLDLRGSRLGEAFRPRHALDRQRWSFGSVARTCAANRYPGAVIRMTRYTGLSTNRDESRSIVHGAAVSCRWCARSRHNDAMRTLELDSAQLTAWREHARESILEINDGIASAAGVAEGFATAGATVHTLLLAGLTLIVAGALAAAGARYSEVRTEWEMSRSQIEQERANLVADPEGEMEELVGIYQAKGLEPQLARQVAEALSRRDAVAAHVDAELGLDRLGTSSGAVLAAAIAGLSYGLGAVVPLLLVYFLPAWEREVLTL